MTACYYQLSLTVEHSRKNDSTRVTFQSNVTERKQYVLFIPVTGALCTVFQLDLILFEDFSYSPLRDPSKLLQYIIEAEYGPRCCTDKHGFHGFHDTSVLKKTPHGLVSIPEYAQRLPKCLLHLMLANTPSVQ